MGDDLTGLLGTVIVLGVAKKMLEDKPLQHRRLPANHPLVKKK